MTYRFSILMALLFLFCTVSVGQDISEKLGGVHTSFELRSDSLRLFPKAQVLIKRGLSYKDINTGIDQSNALGYGLQVLYFEFISNSKIKECDESLNRFENRFYKLKFYDQNNDLILQQYLGSEDVHVLSNGGNLYTYSLNFKTVPVVILDKCREIEICKLKKHN